MEFNKTSAADGSPLFRQVHDHIAGLIERGELLPHDKLPSVRLLAEQLGIHRLTAYRAYRMLKENGTVYVKEKSGYYVSPDACNPDRRASTANPPAIPVDLTNVMGAIHRMPATYQLSQALIDPNLLPNLFLSDYVKQVFDIHPKALATYSSAQGDDELRTMLSAHLGTKFRLPVPEDQIMITTGAQQALDLLARIYVRPFDAVMVERPTYSVALDIFRAQGARLLPVDIAPSGYDLDQVEHWMKTCRPRLFYMNPTFHNPTGYTVPAEQRKQLVDLAEQYRCLLVEDDAYHDLYYEEPPPPPVFTYDTEGLVVYVGSYSKYIAPGLRICSVYASPDVTRRLVTAKSLADNGSPLINQKIFLHYFGSDRVQKHIAKLRTALQIRRDAMEEALSGSGWRWTTPGGGLNLWIRLQEGVSADRLMAGAFRQSISAVPGSLFDPLGQMDGRLRISFSFMSEAKLREAAEKLIAISSSL